MHVECSEEKKTWLNNKILQIEINYETDEERNEATKKISLRAAILQSFLVCSLQSTVMQTKQRSLSYSLQTTSLWGHCIASTRLYTKQIPLSSLNKEL
jgi:hypothetical protein